MKLLGAMRGHLGQHLDCMYGLRVHCLHWHWHLGLIVNSARMQVEHLSLIFLVRFPFPFFLYDYAEHTSTHFRPFDS